LAPLAYHLLLTNSNKLLKLRSKLEHIILDEYQDVSVSQLALIRLIVRGTVDESKTTESTKPIVPPVLATKVLVRNIYNTTMIDCPHIFCAGDSEQSIYGFRGAAPELSVGGFCDDFPMGSIAHLEKSFRLARNVWLNVNSLIPDDGRSSYTETTSISPVCASTSKESFLTVFKQGVTIEEAESLADMLSKTLIDELTGTMHIQGVWDCREEGKHIAMMIKRRSKERLQQITRTWKSSLRSSEVSTLFDPTEVAIIVRAGNQLDLIGEALEKAGVPYVDRLGSVHLPHTGNAVSRMKPVVLITMHGCKGEEFDDVYLPGWTEGVFPHPSAVSSNRVDEERRLAYVAISRARHKVFITHAYVRRALHTRPHMEPSKLVTMQVRPSRFLYELVPNGAHSVEECSNNTYSTITWDRSRGSKGEIAGANIPNYFRNSYFSPKGSTAQEHPDQELLTMERNVETKKKLPNNRRVKRPKVPASDVSLKEKKLRLLPVLTTAKLTDEVQNQVVDGLHEILSGKYGSCTKFKKVFLSILKDTLGMSRGKILIFPIHSSIKFEKRLNLEELKTYFATVSLESVPTRPMSQSTALQLGIFLMFNIILNSKSA
jgi:UvrD-like helicase C-terminal domain/UvrD/REP helicase N-terminal domain